MTDTDAVGLDHNPILTDTTAPVAMIPTEAIPGDIAGATDNITGIFHDVHTQVHIHTNLTVTLHVQGHLHTAAHQLLHKITAVHALDQPTGKLGKPHIRIYHIPEDPMVMGNSRVTINDPQTDVYSSDDNSSGSEEDADHLN